MFVRILLFATLLALAGCPRTEISEEAPAGAHTVVAVLETPPVDPSGDAADDAAIWVNPVDPALSVVIGTDKRKGLYVYDLQGRLLQTLADGHLNNVDLRDGFPLAGLPVTVVAANNRTDDTLVFYVLDPATRMLTRSGTPVATGLADPLGLCMYKSPLTGNYFVFVNNASDGTVQQWQLRA